VDVWGYRVGWCVSGDMNSGLYGVCMRVLQGVLLWVGWMRRLGRSRIVTRCIQNIGSGIIA
jgi:hypothetical protein